MKKPVKKLMSLALAAVFLLGLLPVAVPADDGFAVRLADCVEIGTYSVGPAYLYTGAVPADAAEVTFADHQAEGTIIMNAMPSPGASTARIRPRCSRTTPLPRQTWRPTATGR